MKIFFLCLIITCCTYLGYGFSSYYRRRLRLFKDVLNFASKMIVDINFSRSNLKEIIQNSLSNYGSDFKTILNNFLSYLGDNSNLLSEEILLSGIKNLSVEDKQTLFLFFKGLGRYDAESQIKELENYKKKFDDLKLVAEAENKKYGGLYIKLGLMLGLLIAILLI